MTHMDMRAKKGRPRKPRISKCHSGICGTCRSCKTRDCWRRGMYVGMARPTKWLAEEDDTLRTIVEQGGDAHDVQVALKRIGQERPIGGIQQRACKLCLSFEPHYWSAIRVSAFFGTSFPTVIKVWLQQGFIKAERKHRGNARYSDWVVQEQALVDFIRNYPWAYDASRITLPRHPLAILARQIQARDMWIDSAEAARRLGLSRSRTIVWIHRGALHSERRHCGAGGQHGLLMVRAVDIPEAKQYIEAKRQDQREQRHRHLHERNMQWRRDHRQAA